MVPAWVRARIRNYVPAGPNDTVAPSYVIDAYVCYGERGTFRTAAGVYDSITISYATLAKAMGCSRATAIRASNVLEAVGALTRAARTTDDGDRTSNDCTLIFGALAGPPAEPAPEPGSPFRRPPPVSSGDHGGLPGRHNPEPLLPTTHDPEEKLASTAPRNARTRTTPRPEQRTEPARPDKVHRALAAAGVDPDAPAPDRKTTVRASIGAYLAGQGKGLGVVVIAADDGTLPDLIAAWRAWAAPVPIPAPVRRAELAPGVGMPANFWELAGRRP